MPAQGITKVATSAAKRRLFVFYADSPDANAKFESFMKTLQCEEIRASEYRGIEDLRKNVADFVDTYYNTQRLHSPLGYKTPEQFEVAVCPATAGENDKMSFSRHRENFQSDGLNDKKPPEDGFPNHRLDESPTGYSSPGWSPPEPGSASPASLILKCGRISKKKNSRMASVFTAICLSKGVQSRLPKAPLLASCYQGIFPPAC